MGIKHVVLSVIVSNLDHSLGFYQQVFDLQDVKITDGVIMLDLPGMMVFLANEDTFTKYTGLADMKQYFPKVSIEGFFSCAVETKEAVDELLKKAAAAGGKTFPPQIRDHTNGWRQYIGSFKDPDGHLWQLVYNIERV